MVWFICWQARGILRKSKAAGPGCDQLLTLVEPLDWWWASASTLCCPRLGASLLVVTMFLALAGVWWGRMECRSGTKEDREEEEREEEQQGEERAGRCILGLASRARRRNIGVDGRSVRED